MCGIVGFNFRDRELLLRMMKLIEHRGPDQHAGILISNFSLGHQRLSIIDLSEKGRQPMCNEEGDKWVVFNGEIYNFKSIREDLERRGHKFRSNTDTEVIIHAYEEYGYDCVNHFNGMFAFAILDNKRLFIARDHVGVKPIYYYFNNNNPTNLFFYYLNSFNNLIKSRIFSHISNPFFHFFNFIIIYVFPYSCKTHYTIFICQK